MHGYHMIIRVWGRWRYLDVALQAGGNFRIWSVCWNGNEPVALSGQIIVMADPCMVGIKMKIHRFDLTTVGWNEGGVQNIDGEHHMPISWLFFTYRAVMHDGGLSEFKMVHLFCKIAQLHGGMLSTAALQSWLLVFHHNVKDQNI